MQTALITGASSGIGLEFARLMATKGHDLVLVSRDLKQLKEVQKEIEKTGVSVSVIAKDLSKPGAAKELHAATKGQQIDILINNAGVGLLGDFFSDDLAANQTMAYLNMNSLMDMTHYFGNDMIRRGQGKILNTASIVSFFPGPHQPVYYATKAFVRSLTRALAYNLKGSGVTVTALHPGTTKTNFFKNAKASFFTTGASPADVAATGYNAMMAGKVEVTHGFANKILTNVFVRVVPYRLQVAIVARASKV